MTKLKCILLVDDSEPTNFLNARVIKKMDCAEKVVSAQNGLKALEYIKSSGSEQIPIPDLILLDINMPVMNGWEFIEEYSNLDEEQKKCVIVVMLTTSLNPEDEENARNMPDIKDFVSKPLTPEKMTEILNEHFSG